MSDKPVGGLGEVFCSFADEADKFRRLAAPACEDLRCSLAVDSIYLLAEEVCKAAQLLGVLQLGIRSAVLIDYDLKFFRLVVLQVFLGLVKTFANCEVCRVKADVMCFAVGRYFDINRGFGGHCVFHCVHVVPPKKPPRRAAQYYNGLMLFRKSSQIAGSYDWLSAWYSRV